ncbi:hypothetical protein L1887_27725 [Cichorium endivia]|nr:hypothetical protein L1887_27725 [Cichorium endivia]
MYNNTSIEYNYPTSDLKKAISMFGTGGDGHEVSTTGSSSEGGSSLSQMSHRNYDKGDDSRPRLVRTGIKVSTGKVEFLARSKSAPVDVEESFEAPENYKVEVKNFCQVMSALTVDD